MAGNVLPGRMATMANLKDSGLTIRWFDESLAVASARPLSQTFGGQSMSLALKINELTPTYMIKREHLALWVLVSAGLVPSPFWRDVKHRGYQQKKEISVQIRRILLTMWFCTVSGLKGLKANIKDTGFNSRLLTKACTPWSQKDVRWGYSGWIPNRNGWSISKLTLYKVSLTAHDFAVNSSILLQQKTS